MPFELPTLDETLFAVDEAHDALVEELREVQDALRRAERKLEAIESLDAADRSAIRTATMHTRLYSRASGYAFAEVDDPPPRVGDALAAGGALYVCERLVPSPLPDDVRRCAVLVPVA